ncbi:hypothetical protein HanRHA438_Chr08g0328671 [Helianthus annuus]|nr:hypothetical protein HanHA300_Chr08g0262911 [Helianthus annuus]KAJ0551968.1 hypothetical protein HanHA89_Chr08g0279691 [Helianthus annuus]KAJ0717672.1 hypothetical protein HanLR1_Chr08g0261861 [Helianthus annuus]KAJ0720886.1 hypothetical protein HanOQP8_Chr08g0269081 [Helianthus annuus]KAJ0895919.1 hypothetical protein HanRHA438_Chr08g0328671 [Helianthus annuus]
MKRNYQMNNTAVIIRAENAENITQRSFEINPHIRPRARNKVTGFAFCATSTSSRNLHHFPPGSNAGINRTTLNNLSDTPTTSSPP